MEKKSITTNNDSDAYLSGLSVNCVVFCFNSGTLKILLSSLNKSEKWNLIGGAIGKDESSDQSMLRIIKDRIGVNDPYLKQYYFFSEPNRLDVHFADSISKASPSLGGVLDKTGRLISLSYYSFIKEEEAIMTLPNIEKEELAWFNIHNLPNMQGDHGKIVEVCLSTLKNQVGFLPIGYGLLPEKFTLPELRIIYETILGRTLDRRNFQRKILSIGYVLPLNECRKIGAHKSPNLYTFVKEKYDEAAEKGIQIMTNNL